ncbi:MAG TPA: hypothetical protein VHT91_06315 [Kofleriaceae bacterium]|nr:hypothetical protein [Kofleriaceae bacterium]
MFTDPATMTEEQRQWVELSRKLWRRAERIAAQHPGMDVSGVYHVLWNLRRPVEERLRRGLTRHAPVLSDTERRFLEELNARGVRYMVVGLSAATVQGANTSTQEIDLWFAIISDPQIGPAAAAAGGIWVSGFGMMPAQLGGALGDRFDVVNSMSGLGTFDKEYPGALDAQIDGVTVKVLPLSRILASKRAADRPKDRAVIPALEETLAAIAGTAMNDDEG